MFGVDLEKQIIYKHSSLRFFGEGEHHIARICPDDVLLLVYDGVLRFSEDGTEYEIHPGEYHIQKHDTVQAGERASDNPKYLYVHFFAEWKKGDNIIPKSGKFDYAALRPFIEQLDMLAHSNAPYIVQEAKFYELLLKLHNIKQSNNTATKIADFIAKNYNEDITLETLCNEFHFSKNHIINIFKKEFGATPIAYINHIRLQKAEYLIEVTADSLETIAFSCGYKNYSHFYKQFVHKNGISPEKWRENMRIG